jgi:hypothetical protein
MSSQSSSFELLEKESRGTEWRLLDSNPGISSVIVFGKLESCRADRNLRVLGTISEATSEEAQQLFVVTDLVEGTRFVLIPQGSSNILVLLPTEFGPATIVRADPSADVTDVASAAMNQLRRQRELFLGR